MLGKRRKTETEREKTNRVKKMTKKSERIKGERKSGWGWKKERKRAIENIQELILVAFLHCCTIFRRNVRVFSQGVNSVFGSLFSLSLSLTSPLEWYIKIFFHQKLCKNEVNVK